MAYYVQLDQMKVVRRPPWRAGEGRQEWIHTATAVLCDLVDGQVLSAEQLDALRKHSAGAFRAANQPILQRAESLSGSVPPTIPAPSFGAPAPVHVQASAESLYSLSKFVGALFAVLGVLGVIGGIVVAFSETTVSTGLYVSTSEHQRVTLGVAIAVTSAVQTGLILVVTNAAALFASYVTVQVQRAG